jgi:hypothetical protein
MNTHLTNEGQKQHQDGDQSQQHGAQAAMSMNSNPTKTQSSSVPLKPMGFPAKHPFLRQAGLGLVEDYTENHTTFV